MICYLADIIRINVADHVARGSEIDVYQFAFELHQQYPSQSERELAQLIGKIVVEAGCSAVAWEQQADNNQC